MSKFTKCALAGAIAIAFSGSALAAANITATNGSFAHEVTGTNATNADPHAIASSVAFSVTAPDILIGRSSITGQVTVSGTITGAEMNSAPVVTYPVPGAGTAASTQGSVTSGTNSFQFVVLPPDVAAGGFAQGTIFTISALDLKNATALSTLGGQVTVSIEVRDTTTGTLLSSATVKPVLTSVQASATAHAGAADTTINVMDPSLKTQFVAEAGKAGLDFATLGKVTVSQVDVDAAGGIQAASAAGTGATTNEAAGVFVFDAGDDQVKLTLSVPSADAFTDLYVAPGATACDNAATGSLASFAQVGTTTEWEATVDIGATTGDSYNICAIVDGTTKIDAQTIGLKSQIELAGPLTVNPPAKTTSNFHTLKYNGSVVEVDHFNPASNTTQISYLRVINPSSSSGLVHIEGVCDDGTVQPAVTLTLDAGNAVLRTAQQLNAAGFQQCTSGKSRLTVTGEFDGMKVQNFLRNVTADGTQINTNVNNQN